MLRVAFVLRSTEVHPEFCGLSSPFFPTPIFNFATGVLWVLVVLVVPAVVCAGLLAFSWSAGLGTTIAPHAPHEGSEWCFTCTWISLLIVWLLEMGGQALLPFISAMSLCYWGSLAYARWWFAMNVYASTLRFWEKSWSTEPIRYSESRNFPTFSLGGRRSRDQGFVGERAEGSFNLQNLLGKWVPRLKLKT